MSTETNWDTLFGASSPRSLFYYTLLGLVSAAFGLVALALGLLYMWAERRRVAVVDLLLPPRFLCLWLMLGGLAAKLLLLFLHLSLSRSHILLSYVLLDLPPVLWCMYNAAAVLVIFAFLRPSQRVDGHACRWLGLLLLLLGLILLLFTMLNVLLLPGDPCRTQQTMTVMMMLPEAGLLCAHAVALGWLWRKYRVLRHMEEQGRHLVPAFWWLGALSVVCAGFILLRMGFDLLELGLSVVRTPLSGQCAFYGSLSEAFAFELLFTVGNPVCVALVLCCVFIPRAAPMVAASSMPLPGTPGPLATGDMRAPGHDAPPTPLRKGRRPLTGMLHHFQSQHLHQSLSYQSASFQSPFSHVQLPLTADPWF